MSQTDLLAEISGKLDKVLRLLALDVVKGYEKEGDKIELLDSLGFRPIEIATFLNKTQDNVNRRLSELRKKSKQAKTVETEEEKANSN
jgi:DNA-directed RNA polymerase specialized sigma24 family protein